MTNKTKMMGKPAGMSDAEWAERCEEFMFHPDILCGSTALPRRVDGSRYADDEPAAVDAATPVEV